MKSRVEISIVTFDTGNRASKIEVIENNRTRARIYCDLDDSKFRAKGDIWGGMSLWCDAFTYGNEYVTLKDDEARRLVEAILGPFDFARPALQVAA